MANEFALRNSLPRLPEREQDRNRFSSGQVPHGDSVPLQQDTVASGSATLPHGDRGEASPSGFIVPKEELLNSPPESKISKELHGVIPLLESPVVRAHLTALIEVLAFAKAVNLVSDRANAPRAFLSWLLCQRGSRAEVAPLAIKAFGYDKNTVEATVQASVVNPVSESEDRVLSHEPAEQEAIVRTRPTLTRHPLSVAVKTEVSSSEHTSTSSALHTSSTERSRKSTSPSNQASTTSVVQHGNSFTKIPGKIIVGVAAVGAISLSSALIYAADLTMKKDDQKLLQEAHHLRQEKLLGTINTGYIYGKDNGGMLIPESPQA